MIEKVGHEVQSEETLLVKISVKGPDESPEVVKVELLSFNDYYFLYEHTCDVFDYQEMRESQGLTPQFVEYLTMLIKLFNKAIDNPDTYRLATQLNRDNSADLFFNQILPYKQLQLLGIHFAIGEETRIEKHIKYRHQISRL